jgi:hypothetical protein
MSATLPAVRMALFCEITSGLYDILLPYLWYVWHCSVTLPVVCIAFVSDLSCGMCRIILLPYLWYL